MAPKSQQANASVIGRCTLEMCVCVRACVRIVYIVPVPVISWATVCVPRLGILSAIAENVPETKFSNALKSGQLVYLFGK